MVRHLNFGYTRRTKTSHNYYACDPAINEMALLRRHRSGLSGDVVIIDDSTFGLALGLGLGLGLRLGVKALIRIRVRGYEESYHLGGVQPSADSKIAFECLFTYTHYSALLASY